MRAACYAFVREPPPESLSLYVSPLGTHHSSHMPLGRVYGVYEMTAFGAGYQYAKHVVIFPGDTWIDIVHDSEGSLIMYHGFVYEALLHNFINIGSL